MKSFLLGVGVVAAISACSVQKISNYNGGNVALTADSSQSTPVIDSMIAPYRSEMEVKMNRIIGQAPKTYSNSSVESNLGNFVADVTFQAGWKYASTQNDLKVNKNNTICLLNFGGLRAPINQGDILVKNIYELMPFDNEIVVLKLEPNQVVEMLEYLFEKEGQPVSNAKILLSKDEKRMDVGGQPFDLKQPLYVITSDYLAKGGDKMNFFKSSIIHQSGVLIRDALLQHVETVETIDGHAVEGRIELK